jgi:hypothetical protein
MTRVGTLQGTYLGIYPAKVCDYWTAKPRKTNCKFCSVGLNLGADDADDKSVTEVMEVVRAARDESGITYVDFNTGHYAGDTYLDILEPYVTRIKKELGLPVGVQTPPHRDLRRYDTPCAPWASTACPSASRSSTGRSSRRSARASTRIRARLLPGRGRLLRGPRRKGPRAEPWVTNGEIIAGLEPPESSIRAIDWITSVGAIPTVCVFRPLVGTDMEDAPPPRTDDLVPVFRRLYEACMDRGLPIGCAPNVHVSLVLLPEECRDFSSVRYPFRTLKLKALAHAVRWQTSRNARAALPN